MNRILPLEEELKQRANFALWLVRHPNVAEIVRLMPEDAGMAIWLGGYSSGVRKCREELAEVIEGHGA